MVREAPKEDTTTDTVGEAFKEFDKFVHTISGGDTAELKQKAEEGLKSLADQFGSFFSTVKTEVSLY